MTTTGSQVVRQSRSATLRLTIDGEWTAKDFQRFFTLFEELYSLRVFSSLPYEKVSSTGQTIIVPTKGPEGRIPLGEVSLEVLDPNVSNVLAQISFILEQMHKSNLLHAHVPLQARRVQFGSKGVTDFLGIAGIIKELRMTVSEIVEFFQGREARRLDLERRRVKLDEEIEEFKKKKLETQAKSVELSKTIQELQQMEIETESKKWSLAMKQAKLLERLGWSKEQIRRSAVTVETHIDAIADLVADGKLLAAAELEGDADGPE